MKLGLIGEKLSHSMSPFIHTEAQNNLELFCNYSLIEISEDYLKKFILENKEKYKGFNITIPYKVKAMDYVDCLSEEAREIDSINTINYKDGKIFGYNTDYFGFKKMLEYHNVKIENKKVSLLGFGGSAKAVLKYLLDEKAEKIKIIVRNIEKTKISLDKILKKSLETKIEIMNFKKFEEDFEEEDVIINTTPIGMYPNIEISPISKSAIKKYKILVDLIYNPLETLFLKFGREEGKKTINGLFMLVGQGIASEEIWLEQKISDDVIEKIMKKLEQEMKKGGDE